MREGVAASASHTPNCVEEPAWGQNFEVYRAACAPLHLQNLFPIAYYGLRTSGRLGRYKVSAVEVFLRCDVLQLGQRVLGSGNALCWQTVAR